MGETYNKENNAKPVSEDGKFGGLSYGVSSVQGWRSTQEDAHLALPNFDRNTSLWAVFDGHNGAEVAQFAAKRLPKILLSNKNYKEGRYETALQESFMAFDDLLLTRDSVQELINIRQSYSQAPITRSNAPAIASGCTAIVALLRNGVLYVANIGDSRCILSRNGKAYPMSVDHKPDNESERARIESAGGEVVCGRINYGINVSRAFGDHLYKRNAMKNKKEQMIIAWPDVKTEQLTPNDNFMALICDGVWNSVSNDELISYAFRRLPKVRPISKICEEVFDQILPKVMPAKGVQGKDNMTFLIVKWERTSSDKGQTKVKKISSKDSMANTPIRDPNLNPNPNSKQNAKK